MPKLPSDEVLGRIPSAESGRPFVSLNTSAPGAAMEQMGKGIADLGKGIAAGVKAFSDDQNDLTEQKAKSWHLTQRVALEKKHDDTEDEEVLKKRQEEEQSLVDQTAAMMGGRAGEKYKLDWAPKVAAYGVKAQDKIATLQKNRDLAEANDWLEMMKDVGSNPDVSEENRLAAIQLGNETFDQMREKGYLNDVQVNERKKAWATDYAYKAFELMKPEEVAMVLATPYTTNDREERAYRYFLSKGWSPVQAAGIVGVLSHESAGMQTKARNPGDGNDGSDSIGLAQWNAERAVRLKNFAASMGKDWHDFDVQLAFVDYELNTTHREAARRLTGATTVRDAASAFTEHYEKPQGTGQGGYDALIGWGDRLRRSSAIAERYAGIAPESMRGRDLAGFLSTDDQRRIMEQKGKEFVQSRRQVEQDLKVEQSTVSAQIKQDLASLEKSGVGLDGLTEQRVTKALGPEAAADWKTARDMAKTYYDTFANVEASPLAEIYTRVDALRPKGGEPNFIERNQVYEKARKQVEAIREERETDPALAADRHTITKPVRQAAEYVENNGTRALTPNSAQSIVAARLEAQRQLGIQNEMPITRAEGAVIARQLRMIGEDNTQGIQRFMRQLEATYGEYALMVLQSALIHEKVNRDLSAAATEILQAIKMGAAPKVSAVQQTVTAVDNQQVTDAMAGRTSATPRTNYGRDVAQTLRDQNAALAAQDAEYAKMAQEQAANAPPRVTYDPKDVRALWEGRSNPDVIFQFNAKYGMYGKDPAGAMLKDLERRFAVKPAQGAR